MTGPQDLVIIFQVHDALTEHRTRETDMIRFAHDLKTAAQLIEAAYLLDASNIMVTLVGTWQDKQGNLVFPVAGSGAEVDWTSGGDALHSLVRGKRGYILAKVDGEWISVRAVDRDSGLRIEARID